MARKQGTGSRHQLAGLYERERRRLAELALMPDPRLWDPENGWPTDPAELQKLVDASPCCRAARRRLEAMAVGEPMEVATLSLRRDEIAGIPWLWDPNVRSVLVDPHDRVTPAYH